MTVVYITIGNSDDKLSQAEWAAFQQRTDSIVAPPKTWVYGRWTSLPTSPFQNACWCVRVDPRDVERMRRELADLALEFRQDAIAWAEATAEMIGASSRRV